MAEIGVTEMEKVYPIYLENCLRCLGSGVDPVPAQHHHPRCDGSCLMGCPIPVEVPCGNCGGYGKVEPVGVKRV